VLHSVFTFMPRAFWLTHQLFSNIPSSLPFNLSQNCDVCALSLDCKPPHITVPFKNVVKARAKKASGWGRLPMQVGKTNSFKLSLRVKYGNPAWLGLSHYYRLSNHVTKASVWLMQWRKYLKAFRFKFTPAGKPKNQLYDTLWPGASEVGYVAHIPINDAKLIIQTFLTIAVALGGRTDTLNNQAFDAFWFMGEERQIIIWQCYSFLTITFCKWVSG